MNDKVQIWFIVLILLLVAGCSTRHSKQVITENSTVYYTPKDSNQVKVSIDLGRKFLKATRQLIFTGQHFPVAKDETVHAYVNVDFKDTASNNTHVFHLQWIDQEGKDIYTKEFKHQMDDTASVLYSSIFTEGREKGNYSVRVFYFRELIAEKHFYLVDSAKYSDSLIDKVGTTLSFGEKYSRKKQKLLSTDTVFYKGPGKWVNTLVRFRNEPPFEGDQVKFKVEWLDPKGDVAYDKWIKLNRGEDIDLLRSSISIDDKDRDTGLYTVNFYWFDQRIAQNHFRLKPEEKMEWLNVGNIPITLSVGKSRKKSENLTSQSKAYTGKGRKIYASFDFSNAKISQNVNFEIQWLNPEGIVFFSKTKKLADQKNPAKVLGSISLNSKRKSGTYKLRIVYQGKIIAEKSIKVINK
jgi:hypothetical protein